MIGLGTGSKRGQAVEELQKRGDSMNSKLIVNAQRRYRRISLTKRLTVQVYRILTVLQEWLEGGDPRPVKTAFYFLIILILGFLAGQVLRAMTNFCEVW